MRAKILAGYKWTETGGIPDRWRSPSLPAGWTVRSLRSVLRTSPAYGINAAAVPSGDRLPTYLRITDISDDHRFRPSPRVAIEHPNASAFFLQEGDLVLARTGASVGKSYLYDPADGPLVFAGFLIRVQPNEDVQPAFLAYCVQSERYWSWVAGMSSRSGQPGINGREYGTYRLWLPLPDEQRAIAEALSDMDGLIESLEGLVAKKRAVKTAAMQQFLSGRTRLPGFSGEWETKCVGDVASVRDEKVLPSCVEASTLCVELDHIGQDSGRLTVHSTAESSTSSKYCFIAGDVLFGRLRPYLRKFWYADRSGICTTEIWPLVVDPKQMNGGFLYLMVQTERFMEAASISYGTHMPRADWEVVRNLEISLPSLGEQGSIVAVFADIDAEIVALEHRLAKVRALKQGTMQQLLTGRIRLPTADAPARDQVESVEEEPVGAAPMEGGVT